MKARNWTLTRREMIAALGTAAGAAALGGLRVARANDTPRLIRTREIPSSGQSIPAVGLGSARTFDVAPEPDELRPLKEVLRRFFILGGRVVDTSPMYGRAEATLGRLLGPLDAANPFLATKVWTEGREEGVDQMKESMETLGAGDEIELMQVHNLVDWKTHLKTLRAWKEEGIVRYIGVTHYQKSAYDELETIIKTQPIDFVQLPYSIADRSAEKRLLPAASDRGVAVLVMRPFERGALFRQVKGKELPAWASEYDIESWAQYFLKFILGHAAVTCPIPATSDPEHLVDNMGAGCGGLPDAAGRRKMIAHLER